ncbi:RNase adaptor protein RapZ [Desulfuribacillus stibiiarsenatis]|uniref:RNase adaptor protein RapZ n=1 Tax=Desulfuribacillus stibiiarsenatis TaxID=1390249 RepID=A0A1E5L9X6_9FIRM|nr:RNase adaptor protein RapZ [Desulfuribacillus stibiiarsenatis]
MMKLLVVTGMSGAGKTVAVQALEDVGYFCIDNIPPVLIPKFAELVEQSEGKLKKIAFVVDLRSREFFPSLMAALRDLDRDGKITAQVLFLDATDEVLVKRYKETRRRHPLAPEGNLVEGIKEERKKLNEIKGIANIILDTSQLKPQQLKEKITGFFSDNEKQEMQISIVSFGFKHGVPIDADLMFDVRFLPNPHYVDELRPHTGQNPAVYDYVMQWPQTQTFLEKLLNLLDFLIPQYKKEGKASLSIAIGCTGGRHRSVATTEYLAEYLRNKNLSVQVTHRDGT